MFGLMYEGDILVIGAQSYSEMLFCYEELSKINNEQSNEIRMLTKGNKAKDDRIIKETYAYNELMSLNNELVALQRELIKKNNELDKLNSQKDLFIGMASHDLRNPLNGILSLSELMMEDVEALNPKQLNFIRMINTSGKLMLNIVKNMLDIFKAEAGELHIEFRKCNITELVKESICRNNIDMLHKDISIEIDIDHDLPEAEIDSNRIMQVLDNLLSNAVKYSYKDSSISLKMYINSMNRNEIIISVADKGKGIREDEQYKVFEPFSKISTRPTGNESSTGLGLAIVKKIIELHKGRVWFESIYGEGTTFYVALLITKNISDAL
ncbi:MAG: sensor histidine kinase [Bacillota bacterium]